MQNKYLYYFLLYCLQIIIGHTCYANTCVINLFENGSQLEHKINRIFSNSPQTVVIKPRSLNDIESCFLNEKMTEILLLGHGIETPIHSNQYGAPIFFSQDQIIILPQRFFEKLTSKVATRNTKIAKLRLGFCGSLNSSMNPVVKYLKTNGTKIDFAPTATTYQNYFQSYASYLPIEWLSQSVNKYQLNRWQTDQKSNCINDNDDGCDREIATWTIPY